MPSLGIVEAARKGEKEGGEVGDEGGKGIRGKGRRGDKRGMRRGCEVEREK